MKWMGFGKGFDFELALNIWSDAARQASIEARRATKAAREATRKLHEAFPEYAASDYPKTKISWKTVMDAEKAAARAEKLSSAGDEEAAEAFLKASEIHSGIAEKISQDMMLHKRAKVPPHASADLLKELRKLHREAAEAHGKAGLAHTQAGEVDWRPTETIPEDYYSF